MRRTRCAAIRDVASFRRNSDSQQKKRNKKTAHKLVLLLRKYIAISGEGPPTGGDNNKIPACSGEEPLAGGNN